jgi:hypothetical protein
VVYGGGVGGWEVLTVGRRRDGVEIFGENVVYQEGVGVFFWRNGNKMEKLLSC